MLDICQKNPVQVLQMSVSRVHLKHRGIKYNGGHEVQEGIILMLQKELRFHSDLNVS